MIRINLLPFRAARKKENIRRQVSIVLLSLFLVILLMVYFNISLKNQIKALDAEVKSTKKQIAMIVTAVTTLATAVAAVLASM